MTSKLQVTIPKALATEYGIAPGTEIEFVPAGDTIRVRPPGTPSTIDSAARLRRFDQATVRQSHRQQLAPTSSRRDRGWRRADLYDRGRSR